MLNFLNNYLSGRNQKVVIGNKISVNKQVSSGISQGSILGPILFVLFINDIPSGISDKTNIRLYADDTKIWHIIDSPDDNELLQHDINYVNNWAKCNNMKFYPTKCKVLSVRHRLPSHLFSYKLGDENLDYTECEKDIGFDITPTLNWSHHCDHIYLL